MEKTVREEKRMAYFPLFVDIKGKDVLVAGGGAVAARRVESLLSFGARVTVVAPEIDGKIETLLRQYGGSSETDAYTSSGNGGEESPLQVIRMRFEEYVRDTGRGAAAATPWMLLAAAGSSEVNRLSACQPGRRPVGLRFLFSGAHHLGGDRGGSDLRRGRPSSGGPCGGADP